MWIQNHPGAHSGNEPFDYNCLTTILEFPQDGFLFRLLLRARWDVVVAPFLQARS